MRLLNIFVIAALILAASFVYKIKFDSTLQAERVAKLHNELRRERDVTARLRAEWARLDTPGRIQDLAERHLNLKPIQSTQFSTFDNLPERLPPVVRPPAPDPIAKILDPDPSETTGSIPVPGGAR
jgi:cell division protein FtsL